MTGSPSDELQIAPVVNYEPFTPLEAIRHSYLQDFALKLQKSESSLIFPSPSAVITKIIHQSFSLDTRLFHPEVNRQRSHAQTSLRSLSD